MYKSVFGLKRGCTRCCRLLVCKKSCIHLAKRICLNGIQGVDFRCTKSKVKGKSQAGSSGTGCRSRGPNQDKSLVFAFDLFSVIYFLLCKFLFNANIFV